MRKIIVFSVVTFAALFCLQFGQDLRADEMAIGYTPKEKPKDTKISSQISAVANKMLSMGITKSNVEEFEPRSLSTPFVKVNDQGDIQAYIYVEEVNEENLARLKDLGVTVDIANEKYSIVQGWIPFDKLEAVAGLSFVIKITPPSYGKTRTGSVNTEGDAVMGSNVVRSMLGFDGTGVRVGVISDGVDNMAASMATGDLPGGILVNPALSGVGDEGTAMLEIIHDIAPGAELVFSGGSAPPTPTTLEFIAGIDFLVDTAGVDVLVDDIGFFKQPYFEDGIVAQAASGAVAQGVVYISAAGNHALKHYQHLYVDTNCMWIPIQQSTELGKMVLLRTITISVLPPAWEAILDGEYLCLQMKA